MSQPTTSSPTQVVARSSRQFRRLIRKARNDVRSRTYESVLPPEAKSIISSVREAGLTYLTLPKLDKLVGALAWIEGRGVKGQVIEAGCALGGSTIVMARTKKPDRPLIVHDVFGMIPPPSVRDGGEVHDRYAAISSGRARGLRGAEYYGYQADLLGRVIKNIEAHGLDLEFDHITMKEGLIEDTLTVGDPVALAHIDVDWYDPVTTCLERIVPALAPGGIVILDDYFDWSGCRSAVDDYFADNRDSFRFDGSGGSLSVSRAM